MFNELRKYWLYIKSFTNLRRSEYKYLFIILNCSSGFYDLFTKYDDYGGKENEGQCEYYIGMFLFLIDQLHNDSDSYESTNENRYQPHQTIWIVDFIHDD